MPDRVASPARAAPCDNAGARAGLRVVLLGPRRGSNVGAACRAIKNMGAGALFVVGGEYDRGEARRTAVHAADVFDACTEAATFEDAVADCALVVGTTSRQTPWSIPVEAIDRVFGQARARGLDATAIGLVFGPEHRGLSNPELARCHRLAYVPTACEYSSLNLAQAVVVCLYEWLQSGRGRGEERGRDSQAAAAGQQADALADLRSVLEEIGFLDGDQGERVMASITSMLTRGGLDERDVSILRGIARQVRWAARRAGPPKDPRA